MSAQRSSVAAGRRTREGGQGSEVPIGRYLRLDEIGRGSFATVYQGIHSVSTHLPLELLEPGSGYDYRHHCDCSNPFVPPVY